MPTCVASACSSCERLVSDSLCMPETERIRASRMRENRTSGLKRAEAAVSLPLRYSTALGLIGALASFGLTFGSRLRAPDREIP